MTNNTFTPGPTPNTVRAADGSIRTAPDGWILLPPGDAALTRRVKEAGDHWVVAEKKGRKVFSKGVWASAATIDRIRAELEGERATEGFAKRKEADARRRVKAQTEYVEDFLEAVVTFLGFHEKYADLADRMARAITVHATPVGSGTVARTKRIPIEQRAEAAVIAWMRHKTTGYDGMVIPRIKGKRREVRRMLARRSHELLERYRRGEPVAEGCPLKKAMETNMTLRIQTITETAIYVDDLDATERFYHNILGLRVIAKEAGRHVFFQAGASSVLLAFIADATLKGDQLPPHGARGPGHFALGIEADTLDAWRKHLQDNGIAIEKEMQWPLGGKSLYFRDPAGNSAELVTPGVWGLPSGW